MYNERPKRKQPIALDTWAVRGDAAFATKEKEKVTVLTVRQRQTLEWVRAYHTLHQLSPTLREIGVGLGVSAMQAHRLIAVLRKKGFIEPSRGCRTIIIALQE